MLQGFQDLQDWHTFAPFQNQNVREINIIFDVCDFANVDQIEPASASFKRTLGKFDTFEKIEKIINFVYQIWQKNNPLVPKDV